MFHSRSDGLPFLRNLGAIYNSQGFPYWINTNPTSISPPVLNIPVSQLEIVVLSLEHHESHQLCQMFSVEFDPRSPRNYDFLQSWIAKWLCYALPENRLPPNLPQPLANHHFPEWNDVKWPHGDMNPDFSTSEALDPKPAQACCSGSRSHLPRARSSTYH